MFILRTTTDDNDDCGPDFSSCMTFDPSTISDQSSRASNDDATTTNGTSTNALQHQHVDVRNFIGIIIALSVILVGLCLWRVRILWKTKGREGCCGRRGKEEKRARTEKARKSTNDAVKWTMSTSGQVVALPEKALEIGYGNRWKRTSSTHWRDEEQRKRPNQLWVIIGY
jgi:hypothetical protein